ncbi:hypothetical protein B0A50_00737 [Salinomyces thailandicus]|uniref:Uncharacterized protein n=1 Tax=Salinomyces thailandicus TaxID=706561 RepID=A0A4U0UCX2_9PEZI|nr:hypothetical protein B0A50_00737 [Salinomyces thailandica]
MATTSALPEVLSSFTNATEAALQGLPESSALLPPKDGITLLDTKNDILLAYLQALALRNLNVIRSIKDGGDSGEAQRLSEEMTKKLVEHRVYLERGVRPLESKIKYQVDKVVRAAEDEERAASRTQKQIASAGATSDGKTKSDGSDEEDSDDEAADEIDAEAYRPNPASFSQAASASAEDANTTRRQKSKEDGVYRPPRIAATTMPLPTTEAREKKERSRPERSHTLDEYVSQELSAAPMAEPSIGSTITAGGRKTKGNKQMREEAERTAYEETNLVRLPKESKKERAKKAGRDQQGGGFGGEEWRGLGESLDRIGGLTKRKGGRDGALEKSRKRGFAEDGPRGTGVGDAFEVKRRRMEKKAGRR